MKKTVLISGVAGLLGSRMAEWILEKYPGHQIIGIDNLSGGYKENVSKRVKFFQADVCSKKLDTIFDVHRPNYVFHFAAYAAEGLSPFIRKYNYQNNLIATANVVNCSIKYGIERLVFTSSMAVYGQGDPPFDEKDIPDPIDPYGVAKFGCEMDIKIAGDQHGLDWCIIRPHNVYGVNQNIWDKYRNVLGIWMYQYLHGQPMTIFGDGEQKRAFSFIDDCLEPLWKAAADPRASKQIINLGSSKFYTINEANTILRQIIGGGEVVYKEQRHEVRNAHPTWQKSKKILGYSDKTGLSSGLKIMWDWAKVQPDRKRFKWKNYEIDKGLYSFWR